MMIDRNNYEQYCLDYLDGKLNSTEIDAFVLFLSENKGIKEQLDDFVSLPTLVPDSILFSDKELLKKGTSLQLPVNLYNFNDFCIAFIENDLSIIEKDELKKFIDINPSKSRDFKLFTKTKLNPDAKFIFEHKARLKRHTVGKSNVTGLIRIAASILFIVIIAFVYNHNYLNNNISKSFSSTKNVIYKNNKAGQLKVNTGINNLTINNLAYNKQHQANNYSHNVIVKQNNVKPDTINELSIKEVIKADTNTYIADLKTISSITSRLSGPFIDNINPVSLLAFADTKFLTGTSSVIQNNESDENIPGVIAKTILNKLNELTGNNIKYINKKENSRKVISIQTPLFGFYQSVTFD